MFVVVGTVSVGVMNCRRMVIKLTSYNGVLIIRKKRIMGIINRRNCAIELKLELIGDIDTLLLGGVMVLKMPVTLSTLYNFRSLKPYDQQLFLILSISRLSELIFR